MQRPLTVLCVLLALQGIVGLDQYYTHLPDGAGVGARLPGLRVVDHGAVDRLLRPVRSNAEAPRLGPMRAVDGRLGAVA